MDFRAKQNTVSCNNKFFLAKIFIPIFLFLVFAHGRQDLVRVLQDKPGLLELELNVTNYRIDSLGQGHGLRPICDGCLHSNLAGAPDLPITQFNLITAPEMPTIQIQILETESFIWPSGIAPNPLEKTPTQSEYKIDEKLYALASQLKPNIFPSKIFRGIPIRGIEIPLATWSEPNKTGTLIKKAKVVISFPITSNRPATHQLQSQYLSEVKNPIGGPFLYSSNSASANSSAPFNSAGALAKKNARSISNSNFSLGQNLIKFKVGDRNLENMDEDRLYQISFSDLVRTSTHVNGVRIADLRVYAGPQDSLPRAMTGTILAGTLSEIPIDIIDKNSNGTFDEGDSLQFYGHGTSIWKRLQNSRGPVQWEFSTDPYSFENYYYLDVSASGKSTAALRLGTGIDFIPAATEITSSWYYLHAEKDAQTGSCELSSPPTVDEESGFDWFWYTRGICGETNITLSQGQLSSEETDSLVDLEQALDKTQDSLLIGMYQFSQSRANDFKVYINGNSSPMDFLQPDTNMEFQNPNGSFYLWEKALVKAPKFQIDSAHWTSGARFEGYTIRYRRKLNLSGKSMWIFPSEFGKKVTYKIQGGENSYCLRIEKGIAQIRFNLDSQGRFTDSIASNADIRYFIYQNPSKLNPENFSLETLPKIGTAIQNLNTGDGENPEYLIVTPRVLLEEALKLKEYRNGKSRSLKLKTSVVVIEDIYRQFSSGRMSPPALRDFIRYAYSGWNGNVTGGSGSGLQNASTLKYVLFYGDGNYDYRGIKASAKSPPNLIPPYEFFPGGFSGEEVASDDFYAALDSADSNLPNASLDLAIGRLPIQTPEQGQGYLQKIKDYEDFTKGGEWRSRVVIAADDGTQRGATNDLDPITEGHTTSSNELGEKISNNEPGITIDKILLLDYSMNSAFHKPEAAQDLLSLINRGTLLVNYVGHGASNQWADEGLMQTNDALSRLHNIGKTPMINAFSCTVGRFESLTIEGMSEQFVKQQGIGAIAAISSTRESYPGPNISLAKEFYSRVFPVDSSSIPITIGQAIQGAKNSGSRGVNDNKYCLLGEPVVLLRKAHIGISLTQAPDTLNALDCNFIKGIISGGSGKGMVNIKITAGAIKKSYPLTGGLSTQYADKRGNILFERSFPYSDYKFSTEYFIPKQISFGDSTAQINVFAWDGEEEREGIYAKKNMHIQGTAKSTCATDSDGKGPQILITGCQIKESGNVDLPDRVKLSLPYCLKIQVEDSTGGVLTAEGPDEGTTIEVPGVLDPFHPQAGIDEVNLKTYQLALDKGNFKPGPHLLKVSARDGYGNISTRRMMMDLTADSSIQTVTAYNIPNPIKHGKTTFYFSTILPAPDVLLGSETDTSNRAEFEIRIFNQSGKLVATLDHAISGQTTWDARDAWGQVLGNGVYFYKVTARQNLTSTEGPRPGYRTLSSKRNVLVISH